MVASHGTLPKVCSEPVALRSRDSPCKESRSVSVLCMCYSVGVCAFLVTAKVALMMSCVRTITGRTVWLP